MQYFNEHGEFTLCILKPRYAIVITIVTLSISEKNIDEIIKGFLNSIKDGAVKK